MVVSLVVTAVGLAAVLVGVALFDWRAALVVAGAVAVWAGLFVEWEDR